MLTSYIIHMATSEARKPLVDALCQALPNPQILDAVVGRDLDAGELAELYSGSLYQPKYPFDLSLGEIGCFLSHRKAWQRIVDSGDKAGLIVEDDIVLGDGFQASLDLSRDHIDENRLIRFPLRDKEEVQDLVASSGSIQLFRPKVIGLTTGLQIVGRDAAARLLSMTAQIDRPVDSFLQMRWLTGIDTLTIAPAPVASAATAKGSSTIQSHQSVWAEIKRSWHRARYRAAVKRLSG
ncbi:glycosyltransferase family 25 protein [Pseudooceanicola sp. MF1-13]|uniref:glycosyltransferase family 25 protein n=1 Tax=Pseudooceanicola sp. MF1-13 TaxID=3379095 RepID=UPI003891243F